MPIRDIASVTFPWIRFVQFDVQSKFQSGGGTLLEKRNRGRTRPLLPSSNKVTRRDCLSSSQLLFCSFFLWAKLWIIQLPYICPRLLMIFLNFQKFSFLKKLSSIPSTLSKFSAFKMFHRMIAKKYRHLLGGEGGIFLCIRVLSILTISLYTNYMIEKGKLT